MAANLHISISAETIAKFGSLNYSNSLFTSTIVTLLMVTFFLLVNRSLGNKKKPGGLQNLAEFIIEGLYNMVQGVTGDHNKTRFFMPFFMSFFFFVLFNNWFGLLPGVGTVGFKETKTGTEHAVLLDSKVKVPVSQVQASEPVDPVEVVGASVEESEEISVEKNEVFVPYLRAGTADLNTTLALGLFSQVMAQIVGVKYLGFSYFKKFFNFKDPIMFFVGILELVSEFSKVLSYAFRLFGNIFAGEVLLIVIGALIPVVVPMPFYGLEIFVGFIQALVFALLSLVFFNVATLHGEDH